MEENKVTDNTDRDQQSPLRSVKKANSSSLLSRRRKSIRVPAGDAEGSSTSTLFRDLFDNLEGKEEDAFTPNKENRTPKVSGTMRKNKSLSKSYDRIEIEMIRKRLERIPFQCLLENSPSGFADSLDDASDSLIDQAENTCVQSTRENGMNSPPMKGEAQTNQRPNLEEERTMVLRPFDYDAAMKNLKIGQDGEADRGVDGPGAPHLESGERRRDRTF